MENITTDIRELSQSINRLIAGYTKLLPVTIDESRKVNTSESNVNTSQVMTGYFEMMLGSTKGMLGNMGMMDSGFAKTVDIILQILNSISGGSSGSGFGGLFSGLLGVIGGLAGGPIGAAIGGGIGSILGRSQSQLNTSVNNSSAGNGGVINQVIIKNPVTFTKAFDVEVRTRSLRGGIDL